VHLRVVRKIKDKEIMEGRQAADIKGCISHPTNIVGYEVFTAVKTLFLRGNIS
jgi:hypothetical protein